MYAMVKIHKETGHRELLWFPPSDVNMDEEIKAAVDFYGDKYSIVIELAG